MTVLASYRSGRGDANETFDGRCAFCANDFRDEQRLGRVGDLNIISPLGQVVPSSLVAFHFPRSRAADPCFSAAADGWARDVEEFERIADTFTRWRGGRAPIFYDQVRAGGGQLLGRGGFWHHAHYCSWPGEIDVEQLVRTMDPGVVVTQLDQLSDLSWATASQPYVVTRKFLEGRCVDSRLILPGSESSWTALEDSQLKFALAERLGEGDFRDRKTRSPERTAQTAHDFRAFTSSIHERQVA